MLVIHKRSFTAGAVMAAGFAAVLVLMFVPVLSGRTPLQASDDFFNSVSKHSSFFIPSLREHAKAYLAAPIDMRLELPDADAAARVAALFRASGAESSSTGLDATVKGHLGALLGAALDDSETMFRNDGDAVSRRRGLPGKEALLAWWQGLKQMNKQLRATKKSHDIAKASAIEEILNKGVEVSYNYYGIAPSPPSRNAGVLSLSLVFYLVYTMWWGYAIMWLCDGIGLQMKSHGKREH